MRYELSAANNAMGDFNKSSREPPTLTLQQADACLLSVLSIQAKPGTERHVLKRCGSDRGPYKKTKRDLTQLKSLLNHFVSIRRRIFRS